MPSCKVTVLMYTLEFQNRWLKKLVERICLTVWQLYMPIMLVTTEFQILDIGLLLNGWHTTYSKSNESLKGWVKIYGVPRPGPSSGGEEIFSRKKKVEYFFSSLFETYFEVCIVSIYIPYRTKFLRTQFSAPARNLKQTFRRTKFQAAAQI